jgi:subtilase family serine protease
MKNKLVQVLSSLTLLALLSIPAHGAERQTLHGHVPAAVAQFNLQPVGRPPSTNRIDLVVGLQLHNRQALTNLLHDVSDPASATFRHYLRPGQFTEKFGATEAEYQAVLQFLNTHNLKVARTFSDRLIVDASGTVADVEKAFHVTIFTYQHPTEHRLFYAPDVEPSVDGNVPIMTISRLNTYFRPHSNLHKKPAKGGADGGGGSAPGQAFWGSDFRTAYAPGVSLDGSGQSVGLVEFGGYYWNDIQAYAVATGVKSPYLINIQPGASPGWDVDSVQECSVDIEMVMSMAPNLNSIYVFEGNYDLESFFSGGDFDDLLESMLSYPQIKQFSSSWFGYNFDDTGATYLQAMSLQGQTFFQASGDGDAYTTPIQAPSDSIYATIVGGTTLTMSGNATLQTLQYSYEKAWNSEWMTNAWSEGNGAYTEDGTNGGFWGSGGGQSSTYSIPDYQTGVNMEAVGGSGTMRNTPDVALTADDVYGIYNNGNAGFFIGTSCAAPLWAGFAAMVNEQAADSAQPSVGFLNPVFYSIGRSSIYTSAFHDITMGDTTWPGSPNKYIAVPGYDLCTGWGTPNGQGMINALVGYVGQIWVNFSYAACPGSGTYFDPFCTLEEATNVVASGATISIDALSQPSVSPGTIILYTPITIISVGGPSIIGN